MVALPVPFEQRRGSPGARSYLRLHGGEPAGPWVYAGTAPDRLRHPSDGRYSFNRTYTYDEVGNRLTKSDCGALCTYGYDQADQLLRVGPWGSYVYPTNWTSDENGNLITENYAGNITNNTFDTENRLTKLVQPSGYTEENQYSRDGLRRVRLAGTSTLTYLWDDHVLLRDNAIYTTLPGVTGGLLAAKAGADHRFYVPDMQGHVRQVTDVDGDAIAEYQFDAWGMIQLTAASAMAFGDWGYTWDGKPGRYYVQQRHLRADLGRWMSVDPVETEPPYAYVGDRPTWAVDPSGEQGRRIVVLPTEPKALAEALRQLSAAPPAYEVQRWAGLTLEERARYLENHGVAGLWAWRTEAPSDKPRASISEDWDRKFAAWQKEANDIATARLPAAMQMPRPTPPVSNTTGRAVDIDANSLEVLRHDLHWLIDQVKPKGPWDFKSHKDRYLAHPRLEDFGNYHYGYVCAAFGLPLIAALNEAGRVQAKDVEYAYWHRMEPKPSMGYPSEKQWLPFLGRPPYGDDPVDQHWITLGHKDYEKRWLPARGKVFFGGPVPLVVRTPKG